MLFGIIHQSKNSKISYKPSRLEFLILSELIREGLIFKMSSQVFNYFEIFFKFRFNKCAFFKAKVFKVPGKRLYVSFYFLKYLIFIFPESLFVLSTSKGIITHKMAFFFKIGGELLLRIS
jgi:ribosomal protein S8